MEDRMYKKIDLEDQQVNHTQSFPYTDQLEEKPYLFSLRSKKTLNWEPCLIFDYHQGFDSILPLQISKSIQDKDITQNCQTYRGQFTKDGEWVCIINSLPTGIINYQLIFTDYNGDTVKDVGSFDAILVRQKHLDLRQLRKQTIFPRCVGTYRQWHSFLKKQISLGYNAFHFAPIQQTGSSNSYYSISNHLELSNLIFEGKNEQKYKQLQDILKPFQKEGITFFVDIVMNHTSFDSQWIKKDTNAVFTVENTPILRSAFELDQALKKWGKKIKQNFADSQIQMDQDQYEQLEKDLKILVEELKLEEFFTLKQNQKQRFLSSVPTSPPSQNIFAKDPSQIVLQFIQANCSGVGQSRFGVTIDNLEQNWKKQSPAYEESDLQLGIKKFNKAWQKKIQTQWIPEILKNITHQIKHCYLNNKYRSYDDPYPFINLYFSNIHCDNGKKVPALNNGWVMDADSSEHLVTTKHFYYLKRKVNVWGDLIRIRYGKRPEDSPAWDYMRKYVSIMARHFDGFRLDNLHGTPLHVAEYLIREARKINPSIIIFAELFTGSQQETALFTRRVGINSTLKQMLNNLSGPSFINIFHKIMGTNGKYTGSLSPYFIQNEKTIKYLKRQTPISLIYDLTHDNDTYQSKGLSIIKAPVCVLLELSGAFIGSTKGFDQFYSQKINVTEKSALYLQDQTIPSRKVQVKTTKKTIIFETRHEQVEILGSWNQWKKGQKLFTYSGNKHFKGMQLELPYGVYEYKFRINGEWTVDPRKSLNQNGNHQIIISHNHNKTIYGDLQQLRRVTSNYRKRFKAYRQYYATNDKDVVFLLREKKNHEDAIFVIANISSKIQYLTKNIDLPGVIVKSDVWHQGQYFLYEGLTTNVQISNHSNIFEHFDIFFDKNKKKDILVGGELPPGFSCVIQCRKTKSDIETIKSIKQLKNQPIRLPPLGTLDYNIIMFGADEQQRLRFGISNYVLPSTNQKLIFGGFGGIIKDIKQAKRHNILSLTLFDNLRQGNWILNYYVDRLKRYKTLGEITDIIERYFQCLKLIPSYLKPKYFTTFIYNLCNAIENSVLPIGSSFNRKLMLASHQFFCCFDNPNPLFKITLSAGLPHFCTGWSRSWGRDTFMSNQLLIKHPNIYRDIILQFASTMRHGMIPNLLDFGNNPRFNCRDACWWFIRGISQYVKKTQDYSIFKMKVNMKFLSNDMYLHNQSKQKGQKNIMPLQDVIQDIFQSHADGISYRQWNAGYEIDSNMKHQGFIIKLEVDEESGFVVGGNSYNCLTWMDKMGSSARAGNKGYPATPRAGAPIQMTAILYYCLVTYSKLHENGHYSHNNVQFQKSKISFLQWSELIQKNFENKYYLDKSKNKQSKFQGIYRDVVNVPKILYYESLRLRPNGLVAMVLAPELFDRQHALSYLRHVEQYLIFPKSIGISTLASVHESLYTQFYDNSDDSAQIKIAHGFSYHNGPQWVWLYGFYVAAKCLFCPELSKSQLLSLLQGHAKFINDNEWISLPELTNKNGEKNKFSCTSQAWSISSMFLALEYIEKYGK